MTTTSTQMLRAAIDLVKAGNKEQARLILLELLKRDPENDAAYFWYVDTLNTDEERVKALKEYLKVKPNHERAKNALLVLQDKMEADAASREAQAEEPPVESWHEPPESPVQEKPADESWLEPPEKDDFSDLNKVVEVIQEKPAAPKPKRQRRKRKPISPKVKEFFSRVMKALLVLIMVSLCCVSIVYPTLRDTTLISTPQQIYARKMADPLERIDSLINKSVAEWNTAMDETVYSEGNATYEDMLYYNMKMGYSDVIINRRLSPLVYDISRQGAKIVEMMQEVQPPSEIADAHNQVLVCIQYEVEWSTAILKFLESNTSPQLSEDKCGNFKTAFDMLQQYVAAYNQ